MPKLNKRFIDALKPEDRDIDYFDEALAGLGYGFANRGVKFILSASASRAANAE